MIQSVHCVHQMSVLCSVKDTTCNWITGIPAQPKSRVDFPTITALLPLFCIYVSVCGMVVAEAGKRSHSKGGQTRLVIIIIQSEVASETATASADEEDEE